MQEELITTPYTSDADMPEIMELLSHDLSEPYTIYTYRYFIHNWPTLTLLTKSSTTNKLVALVICKLDLHNGVERGYIAMLAVDSKYRKKGLGSELVVRVIEEMIRIGCAEVVLETEANNHGALALYSRLGFMRDKKLARYYLNGVDAYRLKLWL